MKLLYLAAIRLPTEKAHGLQIMKTCEALADAGAEVELMVPTRRNALTQNPFEYYRARPSFTITRKKSLDVIQFGAIGFFLSLLSFSEAAHFTREFWGADVIYSRDAFVLLQYIFLGRTLIYEAHTTPTALSRFVAKRAKRVVVISNGLGMAYEKAGVRKEHIVVAPDAIDLAEFSEDRAGAETKEAARARLGIPQDKKILMYIGRLDGWKGVITLCEAAMHLSEDMRVVVIGGEPAQVDLLKKKYPRVIFLGFHPYTQIANNQAAADVLVLPNTAKDINSLRYTSPLKLYTYMASGKPILASDLPSIREVVSDQEVFFFEADNVSSLVGSIHAVLASPEIAPQKAKLALALVHSYTWKARAEKILQNI